MRGFHVVILTMSLMLFFSDVHSQQHVLDSLKKQIDQHPGKDTARLNVIMDYVLAALGDNTADFLPYMNEILAISKKIDNRRGLQRGYMIGQIYFSDRALYEKAFLYADSAFAVLAGDTSRSARQSTGYLYNNVAGDYFKLGDYEKAIEYLNSSITIFEPMNHPFLASVYSTLAEVYEKIHQPDKALALDQKAIAIAEANKDERSLSNRLLNYSMRLINQNQFDEATAVMARAEPIVLKLGNKFSLQQFYYNRGYLDRNNGNFNAAVATYKKALYYSRLTEDISKTTDILEALSDCLMDMHESKDAKLYLDTLLRLTQQHGLITARRNAYSNFAKWYETKGDYKQANYYLKQKSLLNDTVYSQESQEKIAALEVRYTVERKEQVINTLKAEASVQALTIRQKNIVNYILIGSVVAIIIISLLVLRSYRQRQKIQQQRITALETEEQLFATEAVLRGEEQERTRLAKDLHDGLGGMLSGIKHSFNAMKGNLIMTPENHLAFERSMDMLDTSIKEMRRVSHNMMPEALLKFGLDTALDDYCSDITRTGSIRVTYQSVGLQDAQVDQTTSIAVYRIVQELVTNILKHSGSASALVQLTKTGNTLSLTVEDDGRGFEIATLENTKGIGWTNIRHRVDFLKGKLDVRSASGKGTSVHIEFTI